MVNHFNRSLLDVADCRNTPSSSHSWLEHTSSITGLVSISGSSSYLLISSSTDGTCKVWDIVSGRLLQNQDFSQPITAISVDPEGQLLFSGSIDGRIFVNRLDIGLEDNSNTISGEQPIVLNGHNGSITALSFSTSGFWLISASEDCTACLWDIRNWAVARRFTHAKGQITNLLVIPRSSLPLVENNNQRVAYQQPRIPMLEKYQQPTNTSRGVVAILPSPEDNLFTGGFCSASSMKKQILELEQGSTPAAIQMKVETNVENRLWATSMARHMTDMNKHLRSRLLDLMQCRLLLTPKVDCPSSGKAKKLKVGTSPPQLMRAEETESPPA